MTITRAKSTSKTVSTKPPTSSAKSPSAKASKADKPRAFAEPGLKAGDKAPSFALPNETGKTVSLADFKGKKVVLYFYPKDNTGGCTKEACAFRDGLPRLGEAGAPIVLGVSADSIDSHRKFKEKQGLNFPLLSDPDRKVLEAYGVWQEKSLYGRKFMGIVRTTFIIDEKGKISRVFPKVKVDGHLEAVLAAL